MDLGFRVQGIKDWGFSNQQPCISLDTCKDDAAEDFTGAV